MKSCAVDVLGAKSIELGLNEIGSEGHCSILFTASSPFSAVK